MQSKLRPGLQIDGESILHLRAGFSDVDLYPEVNNGRHLTLMDLGRFDLAVRTGLIGLARRKNWGLVVGGASIRYRRKIPFFRKFTLTTRLLGHDGRWFYFQQTTTRAQKICSAALIKAGIRSMAGLVPAGEVIKEMGIENWSAELPDWVKAWIAAEGKRPWPEGSEMRAAH
ncbi:MAG: thioesterase family protein [Thermodesulfobacteriota bacterium]